MRHIDFSTRRHLELISPHHHLHTPLAHLHDDHLLAAIAFHPRHVIGCRCRVDEVSAVVRWLTDSISDICRPVIVGDSLMRFSIFC